MNTNIVDRIRGNASDQMNTLFSRTSASSAPLNTLNMMPASLIAQLGAGDLQEHVVQRRRLGVDAPELRAALLQHGQHVA